MRTQLPQPRPPADPEPLPVIQSKVERTGLTAVVVATNSFVVGQAGFYRATVVAHCTTGGDAITLVVNVIHTDRVGVNTQAVVSGFSLSGTGRTSGTYTFEASAQTTVQYSSTLSGARVSSVHAYKIFFERLED